MHLKGLVKFFTAALILISLYQLSLTLIVRNEEKKMHSQAERAAKADDPNASGTTLERLVDTHYQSIQDSMQGELIFSFLKKYTYQQAKAEELSLGLDLQGGMNVTLEVSLDDLVRSMSNNPHDPKLNKAIADANAAKANSEANFITLFGEIYEKENPGASMAYLFTKPSDKDITINSSNDDVLKKLRDAAKEAFTQTSHVIMTRIDKFGVANPNVNPDEKKGIITVELAGVHNPERVRSYLQATAKLQFFETYTNPEIGPVIGSANETLAAYLSGSTDTTSGDSTKKATASADSMKTKTTASDTGNLANVLAGNKGGATTPSTNPADSNKAKELEATKKYPLSMLLQPAITQDGNYYPGPVVGYVLKRDTAKVNKYLALDVVKNKFPSNIHFAYGAETGNNTHDPKTRLPLYALKMPTGGSAKLEGDHITMTRSDFSPLNGKPDVIMDMDITGARIWKEMTARIAANKGFIAVVLDDRVYSAPHVENEISGGNTEISGDFTTEQATDLANILKSGKLPAPAHIVQEQVVGPTLGAESIKSGFTAIALSFLAIFILMLVYYSSSGWVANISLTLNLLFTVGVLSAMHATLTLPGIAGLVLGIGMAVDAHVLIFERIKEELALGKNHQQAIIDGYRRSNAPVLDGHIAQLITAAILFYFGLGPVLGFATTQLLSISISLFCGILVSRLIKDIYTNSGRHFNYFTPVSKAVFRKAHFDFMAKRKAAYIVSVVVVLLGVASLFHGFEYGVEFSGGRSYTIKFDKKYEVSVIREKLHAYFNEYPVVKTIGTNNQVNITTSYLITQPGQQVEQQVQQKLYDGLTKEGFVPASVSFQDFNSKYVQSSQTVLPTISDDLIRGARYATILSLICISIYILLRFRKWQYSLGTAVSLLFNVCATLAAFSFLRGHVPFAMEINQHFIAAILTVIGFSMNDTIIVFDRIREYFRKTPNGDKKAVINSAINDTLPRTVMTSLTVFIVVLILFIVGGEVTRGFAFAMLIGVVTGTYSSIFVAAPVLVDMDKSGKLNLEEDREARVEELKKLA